MTLLAQIRFLMTPISVALGLLESSDAIECSEYIKETQNTDEIIKKLHFFKFGEHYRLLDEIENSDSTEVRSNFR